MTIIRPGVSPSQPYRLVDQVFTHPEAPGLHPMTALVASVGPPVHWRTIEVYGYVDGRGLAHVETPGGDVITWWRWERGRDEIRRELREARKGVHA